MTLKQAYKQYPDQTTCIHHLEQVLWKGSPKCPYCANKRPSALPKENRYHCNVCGRSFSVTTGTIFHKTRIDLQKWFVAISIFLNAQKKISARQMAVAIDVTKDTAWLIMGRLRKTYLQNPNLLHEIINSKN